MDLTRLRKQIAHLAIFFEVPAEFVSEYKLLLEFYHHWSHRQHEDYIPNSFMLVYDLPSQLIPEIELGLKPYFSQKPQVLMPLADALRKDMHFECSDLAAFIVGQTPAEGLELLSIYLTEWLATPLDKAVLEAIFQKATLPFARAGQPTALNFLQTLLQSSDNRLANAGLTGLTLLLPSAKIENLPRLFSIIRPLLQGRDVRQENLELLVHELAKKSPMETGYFINQILSDTDGKKIEVLARSFLKYLPEQTAASVKQSILLHQARTAHKPYA
ncbi:MAG: hypothetical protein VB108_10005 [Anaerolineaceae bacterium]|nr:hypothetical protein [Anaerolineaceae bacterium]